MPHILRDRYPCVVPKQCNMHFPKDLAEYKQALRQVSEELLFFQLQLQVLKKKITMPAKSFLGLGSEKLTERKKQLPL